MPLHELPGLHARTRVFRDRHDAGRVLAGMLAGALPAGTVIYAVPAGGLPVAVEIARSLGLRLDVAVVSKILLPWDTESGYGAVAFDGSVRLNEALVGALGLDGATVAEGIAATRAKVDRRVRLFRGADGGAAPGPGPALLVDDGLASGFTMRTAVEAVRRAGASAVAVAVPTAHLGAARSLAGVVDELWCANVREGGSFAVADAYRSWRDVPEAEALALFRGAAAPPPLS
jgi:predicted phosphoribosyltransferase